MEAGADAALQARPIPIVRLAFVAGAILSFSFAGAVASPALAAVLLLAECRVYGKGGIYIGRLRRMERPAPGRSSDAPTCP